MEPEVRKTESEGKEDTYELVFTNGALINLKKLAADFNVPETDLRQVINKGIRILTLIKSVDTKTIIFENKKGERYTLDADKL